MEQKKTFSEKIAFILRAATVPPVMVTILVIILATGNTQTFLSWIDVVATIFFLAILPVAAYPLSGFIPKLRSLGREGQRDLAFLLSCVGYIAAMIYGTVFHRSRSLVFIYAIYLFSIILLLILNKLLRIRASGHACSVTGPLMIGAYYFKTIGFILGILVYVIVFWSSVSIKRHTPKELLMGTAACILAGGLAWICVYY